MSLNLPVLKNFPVESLDGPAVHALEEAAGRCRGNAVTMVTLADSGHPAGSFQHGDVSRRVYGKPNPTPRTVPKSTGTTWS